MLQGRGNSTCCESQIREVLSIAATGRRHLNILVVDDEEVGREITREILKGAGHRVAAAPNGAVAVEMVARDAYDLVLLDLDMPVMDGFAAAPAIRALPGAAPSLTIVALTARDSEDDRHRAAEAGMDGFLTKPFRLRNIEPWLQGSRRPL
jgi:CheY-like chemotaxis protein